MESLITNIIIIIIFFNTFTYEFKNDVFRRYF